MIIKVTFHDNDYSELLDQFAENFCSQRFRLLNTLEDEEFRTNIKLRDHWDVLMNPRTDDIKEDDVYRSCLAILHKYMEEYIEEDGEYEDDLSYLMQHLSITLLTDYESKRENGEVLYIFLRGDNTWLIQ